MTAREPGMIIIDRSVHTLLAHWRRVIFVDWHGVLSRDPFWMSILDGNHPLKSRLEANLAQIFSRDVPTAHEWMRGQLSSAEIISAMDIKLGRHYRDDFLQRRLDVDCRRMRVNVELFEILRVLRARALIVIATDNMDCFARAFDCVRSRARRSPETALTLTDWAIFCDDIVCSSDVGRLKSEDPDGFFGPWLSAHGLSFADALLIDDRADNCEVFARRGGYAVQWKMGTNQISEVTKAVERWMDVPTGS
ncbi:MAG: hypothetical protein JO309_04200 [Pseudonocardiales bacterium]|nr:hypothetical protein [Pseudonocardiales bacterium]